MGEIAEAMLDGEFCEGCGEYLGDGCGYPRLCGGCGGRAKLSDHRVAVTARKQKCPHCGAWKTNVAAHIAAKHAETSA